MSDQQQSDSITIKCFSPDGFDLMICLRGNNGELMPRALKALDWLKEHEFSPARNGGQGVRVADGGQGVGLTDGGLIPVCPEHGPMQPSSKKAGEWFCPAVVGNHPQTGKKLYCTHKEKR